MSGGNVKYAVPKLPPKELERRALLHDQRLRSMGVREAEWRETLPGYQRDVSTAAVPAVRKKGFRE